MKCWASCRPPRPWKAREAASTWSRWLPTTAARLQDHGLRQVQIPAEAKASKKRQDQVHQKLKEIRLRPKTGDHDIETKVNQARKFLEHKDKVLVYVLFKGRELQHIEEGARS